MGKACLAHGFITSLKTSHSLLDHKTKSLTLLKKRKDKMKSSHSEKHNPFFSFVFLMLVLLSSVTAVSAASFDCTKSRTFVEKTICADPQLSELDEKLDAAYKKAMKISRHPEDLKKWQKEWIKTERDSAHDAAWLKIIYQQQINELERFMASERNSKEHQIILPKDYTLMVVGGTARTVDYKKGNTTFHAEQMDVTVNHTEKPVVLFLHYSNPVIWNINWTSGTRIMAVFICGISLQATAGIDPSVPVRINSNCQLALVDKSDTSTITELLNSISTTVFDRKPDAFYTAEAGKVTAGKPLPPGMKLLTCKSNPPVTYYDSKPPLSWQIYPFERYAADLAKQPRAIVENSIDDAIKKGLMRKATEADVKEWEKGLERQIQRRLIPKDRVIDMTHSFEPNIRDDFGNIRPNAFVILKPMSLPAGNYSLNLIIPKGIPVPKNIPHSTRVFDFNALDNPSNDSLVDIAIRKNSRLAELDNRLIKAFRNASIYYPGSICDFANDQIRWEQDVRNVCKDEICLKQAYEKRLNAIREELDQNTLEPDFDGLYLPKEAVVFAAGGHNTIGNTLDVTVNYPKKPVVLILASSNPLTWTIHPKPKTHIAAVLVSGNAGHKVRGLGSGTVVFDCSKKGYETCNSLDIASIEDEFRPDERYYDPAGWSSEYCSNFLSLNLVSRRIFGKPVERVHLASNGKVIVSEDTKNTLTPGPADGGWADYEKPAPVMPTLKKAEPTDLSVLEGLWNADDPFPHSHFGDIRISGNSLSFKKNDFFSKDCSLSLQPVIDDNKELFEKKTRAEYSLSAGTPVSTFLFKITGKNCTGSTHIRLTRVKGELLNLVEYDTLKKPLGTLHFVKSGKPNPLKKQD